MTSFDPTEIKNAVKERYGERARRAASTASDTIPLQAVGAADDSCCAPASSDDACCGPTGLSDAEATFVKGLYSASETAGLPPGALEAAAGCGNPTAIAELRPGETVLDLGSGGGIDCFLAAKQVGPAGQVIGVDMTPDMISLARENARKVGATNVRFEQGEIESLPLPDANVDVIISNCVINLAPDKDAVFREAYRVLRPGGRLRVSDMVWLGERPPDASGLESWAGCIAGALPLDDYLGAIRRAGFIDARADPRRISDDAALASALVFAEKPGE